MPDISEATENGVAEIRPTEVEQQKIESIGPDEFFAAFDHVFERLMDTVLDVVEETSPSTTHVTQDRPPNKTRNS